MQIHGGAWGWLWQKLIAALHLSKLIMTVSTFREVSKFSSVNTAIMQKIFKKIGCYSDDVGLRLLKWISRDEA